MTKLIKKAYRFAERAHRTQLADDGITPYFEHCKQVAEILKQVTDDEDIIAAGYLHDTVEDTYTTYDELVKEFNKRVADLVMEVTHEGEKDWYGYYFPRLKTRDGILIKLADRMSNLTRIDHWNEKRFNHYLRKTKFWKDGKDND